MDSAGDDLDQLICRVDTDRWLSSRFAADPVARADLVALYAYDHELGRAPRVASSPLLGEIRLTWWREVLDEAFEGRPVRRHPTAQAIADVIARRQLPRGPLEAMIDARYRELDPAPMTALEALDWARDGGGQTAALAVEILDPDAQTELALAAGSAWALGGRLAAEPALQDVFAQTLATARTAVRHLSVAAFPAVAHLGLFSRPSSSEFARRARLTMIVARGRI